MLLGGDFAGDEDPEMPDALVHRVHDGLAVLYDLTLVVVQIEHPVQRLLRRCDVVTPGAENDDWRRDVAEIDAYPIGRADLSGRKPVTNKQVVGDPLHLPGV